MIRLENVTKYYTLKNGDKHYVVDNISLEIPSKKSLAILGPNGAGKSTFLRIIGGAEAPNSGKIITDANISWPLGLNAGFQGSLTGRQNIQFVCEINGLNKSEAKQIMQEVQDFAELDKFFDMPVKSYSSGMRARLGFGLSMCFDFDYYLIDELTSVGDAIFRQKATKAFEEIKEHASLIFVAHNLQTLRQSCDSALFLRNGKANYYENIEDGINAYQHYIDTQIEAKTPGVIKPVPAKQVAAKRVAAKRVAAKRVAAKRVAAKRVAAKRVAAKRVAAKRVAAKRVATKRVAAKRVVTKKIVAKRVAIKKTNIHKTPSKKKHISPQHSLVSNTFTQHTKPTINED